MGSRVSGVPNQPWLIFQMGARKLLAVDVQELSCTLEIVPSPDNIALSRKLLQRQRFVNSMSGSER